jgi:hypothetical protein
MTQKNMKHLSKRGRLILPNNKPVAQFGKPYIKPREFTINGALRLTRLHGRLIAIHI